ncbi:MAG: hypothetical protein ACFE9R_19575, partial [Candidatus Hermodarchaeota archaeon]
MRGDFEKLIGDYEKLVTQEKVVEAHDLVQNFKQYYERDMKLNSIERVNDLLMEDDKAGCGFQQTENRPADGGL